MDTADCQLHFGLNRLKGTGSLIVDDLTGIKTVFGLSVTMAICLCYSSGLNK